MGWNNSGLTTGNLSNLIRYRFALAVTLLGILTGFLFEGQKMSHSIVGNLIVSPVSTQELAVATLISFVLFLVLTLVRIPVSLSNCIVGSFVGVSLFTGGVVSSGFAAEIAASWILAPFLCAGLSLLIYEFVARAERYHSLPTISLANRLLLIVAVFYVSYALGANNMGLIFSFAKQALGNSTGLRLISLEALLIVALSAGTILFGRAIAKVVGDKIIGLSQIKTLSAMLGAGIMTWLLTQLAIPVSLIQLVIGGMLGAGFARRPYVINRREVLVMIVDWILVTLLCMIAGYSIEWLIQLVS